LKPKEVVHAKVIHRVEETDPTKQGLKPSPSLLLSFLFLRVEETDPTKQGLKHQCSQMHGQHIGVEETDPTKQGLKQLVSY